MWSKVKQLQLTGKDHMVPRAVSIQSFKYNLIADLCVEIYNIIIVIEA